MAMYNLGGGGWDEPANGGNEPGYVDWSKLPGGVNPFGTGTNPYAPTEHPIATAPTMPGASPTIATTGPTFHHYPTANDFLLGTLNDKTNTIHPTELANSANSMYGLQSGSGAQYYAAGAHGPGSQEIIGLPGGYFAHENNDPNAPWHWVVNNEGAGGGGASGGAGASGVFSDPATAAWEKALNALVARLQGPAYTPEQQALIQTSVHEPIQQSADAAHQALIRKISGSGYAPTSGIAQDQGNQIDRFYAQQKDLADRGFATNAINLGNQNQASAVDYLKQIPQYADQRLQLALQAMAPQNVNPLSAMNSFLGQQNLSDAQTQQYWLMIGQTLASLFGGR